MLLSLVVESIISCFSRTSPLFRGYIELLPFVTLWIQSKRLWPGKLHWEYKGQTMVLPRVWREDGLKGEATRPSPRYCFSHPRDLLVPLSFLWFVPLALGSCPCLFLTDLHKSSILHSRRGRVLHFQLSVGLALAYSVQPPQSGSLVGPVGPLKIWLLSQCHLWSLWMVYGKRWLMKQFLLFPYLPQLGFPDQLGRVQTGWLFLTTYVLPEVRWKSGCYEQYSSGEWGKLRCRYLSSWLVGTSKHLSHKQRQGLDGAAPYCVCGRMSGPLTFYSLITVVPG